MARTIWIYFPFTPFISCLFQENDRTNATCATEPLQQEETCEHIIAASIDNSWGHLRHKVAVQHAVASCSARFAWVVSWISSQCSNTCRCICTCRRSISSNSSNNIVRATKIFVFITTWKLRQLPFCKWSITTSFRHVLYWLLKCSVINILFCNFCSCSIYDRASRKNTHIIVCRRLSSKHTSKPVWTSQRYRTNWWKPLWQWWCFQSDVSSQDCFTLFKLNINPCENISKTHFSIFRGWLQWGWGTANKPSLTCWHTGWAAKMIEDDYFLSGYIPYFSSPTQVCLSTDVWIVQYWKNLKPETSQF